MMYSVKSRRISIRRYGTFGAQKFTWPPLILNVITVVFPKEGQMRFAGQASRSNKFAILWAADNRNKVFLDLEGYLRELA
jgi:hypothetical protein